MARGLLVWLIIMMVESVHGVLRGLLLTPRLGEEASSRIGWPVGLLLVLLVSYLTIRWTGLHRTKDLLVLGAIWAVLTAGFEVAVGLARGLGQDGILAALNPATGTIPYSAFVMLLAPLGAARLRGVT
jgi:hypothetical protein